MPKYSFIIRDSSGNLYEFENAIRRGWEVYENDIGRCVFFIPHNDVKLSPTSVPDAGFSEILIYRDGVLRWQGIVSIVQDTIDGTWVYGETLHAVLGWYGVRYDQKYTGSAIGTIISGEYDNIAGRTGNIFSAKLTKGTIQNPYQVSTTSNLVITRTLYNDNFLQFLQEMVAVVRGEMTPAWSQQAVFDISLSATAPTFSFMRNVGAEKPDVVFELNSEIVDFNIPRNNRFISNVVKGFAVQEGPKVLTKESTDTTSRTAWYRREAYPYFGSATDQADLDQRTNDLLREMKDPDREMNLKFASGMTPFDGYVMGDSVKVRIKKGRVNIDEYRRVIGMEVSIEDTGIERTVPILQKPRS